MTCETVGTDRTLLVVWGIADLGDAERVAQQVRLRIELTGKPILYVMRLPVDCPAPSAEVRRHIAVYMPDLVASVDQYHVILEGDGFAAATKRGVLTGLSRFWQKRGVFHVHSTVQQFERKVSPEWRADVTRLLHLAEQRRLLEGPLPVERVSAGSGRWLINDASGEHKDHRVA
jgi:hypothetical protein